MCRKKMDVKPFIKPFGYVTSCLAIVQGLTWSILSLLTILIQTEAWIINSDEELPTHGQVLGDAILLGYIVGDEGFKNILFVDVYIRPKNFYIWVSVFFIISLVWIGFSAHLLVALFQNQNRSYQKCLLALGIWTVIVCVADLLLTAILARDYNALVNSYNNNMSIDLLYAVLSCGVLMSIVARGYVMWIINLVLAIILLILVNQFPKQFDSLQNEYSTNSLAFLRNPNEQGRRQRRESEGSFGTFQGLPRVPPVQSTNNEMKSKHNSFMENQKSSMYPSFPPNPKQENHEYFIKPNQNFHRQ
ncbi:hypothetical protein FQR65_LT02060 [Abscondita terminalis]|nr:hypothetical protein FQR65_LT02060 [Abscondita terminalis]